MWYRHVQMFVPILIFISGERSSFFYFCLASIYILLFFPKRNIIAIFLFSLFLILVGIFIDKIISKDVKRFSDRIINQTRVTSDSPNPYAAVYIIAQQQLVRRIKNMCNERSVSNDKEHII